MASQPDHDVVTGTGSIPPAITLNGTVSTDPSNHLRLIIQGINTQKELRLGESIYANNELRKIRSFYPDGSVRIETPFSANLMNTPLQKVLNGVFIEVSIFNNSPMNKGKVNGKSCPSQRGLSWRSEQGLDAISYDTEGNSFIITTTK